MKAKFFIVGLSFVFFTVLLSCGRRNPSVRNDIKQQIKDHLALGVEGYATGDLQSSLTFLNRALSEAYMIDDVAEVINIKINLGTVYLAKGDITIASNYIFSTIDTMRLSGERRYLYNLKVAMGQFYARINMDNKAIESYKSALKLAKNSRQQAVIFNNLGKIYRKLQKNKIALGYLNHAKIINRRLKVYNQLANNFYNIAEIYFAQKDWQKARENYFEALKNDKISENPLSIADDLTRISEIYFEQKRMLLARHFLTRALNVAKNAKSDIQVKMIRKLKQKYRGKAKKEATKQILEKKKSQGKEGFPDPATPVVRENSTNS